MAHPGGRPLKYGNVEELRKRIDAYFDSLWEEDWRPITDKQGLIVEWVQQKDKDGNPLMKLKEQPTITGLAMYLDTSRETLINYQARDQFFEIIKKAKDLCEYWTEKDASNGTINYALGIFKLKNYGWVDKVEISNSSDDSKLSDNEIRDRLNQMKIKANETGK
jgi:hypothetical protein